jgi:hypothetical protein
VNYLIARAVWVIGFWNLGFIWNLVLGDCDLLKIMGTGQNIQPPFI